MGFTRLGKPPVQQVQQPQYSYVATQPQQPVQQEISEEQCSITISGSQYYVEEMLRRLTKK